MGKKDAKKILSALDEAEKEVIEAFPERKLILYFEKVKDCGFGFFEINFSSSDSKFFDEKRIEILETIEKVFRKRGIRAFDADFDGATIGQCWIVAEIDENADRYVPFSKILKRKH